MQRRWHLILAAVLLGGLLFAVGAGTAFATTEHHGKKLGELSSLEDLKGLPCNVGTPDEGVVDFRIFEPSTGSTITFYCLTEDSVTSLPRPTITLPPPITRLPDVPLG